MGKAKQRHRRAVEEKAAAARQRELDYGHGFWPALTGVRGLAAAGVLLFHVYYLGGGPQALPAPLAWLCQCGWMGVDVFFTLSAFLLSLPFVEARERGTAEPSLREYWRHRGWRILPAYWLQVAILFVLALAGARASYWYAPNASSLAVNALFLYDLVPLANPPLPTWWTLPVELGFYLVLPLFVRLLTPTRWWWLLVAIAASLAWRWWVLHAGFNVAQANAWANHLPGRLHQFLVGMLAAWALLRWRTPLMALSPLQRDLLAVLSLLCLLALPLLALPVTGHPYAGVPLQGPLLAWHLFSALLVAVLLLALASGPSRVARVFSLAGLQALGLVSYSLYLWHYPVLLLLRDALGGYQAVKAEPVSFAFYAVFFSLLAAAASWWLVERPAQQRARRDKMAASPARA
jgi:peptidoglycan/LPS O-acetylase OafA/YrhL